jgi:hypothetical protein
LTQVKPLMARSASSSSALRIRRPITTPISASNSTRWETLGRRIVSPGPISEVPGLKKMMGDSGTSLPSSRACST